MTRETLDLLCSTAALVVGRDGVRAREEMLAVEEPMEVRVLQHEGGTWVAHSLAVTMRTPGHDFELAIGFLFAEGVIRSRQDIRDVRYSSEHERCNVVDVVLAEGVKVDPARLSRNFYTTSSCGICGKASLELVRALVRGSLAEPVSVSREVLLALPDLARRAQTLFARTGGVHASALFDEQGRLLLVREDVGRHNAMDKVIGHLVLAERIPASHLLVFLSGRASFELVQKALVAGIPIVAAVGAPSSLAVTVAREFGLTLIGFLRDGRFNVYAGAERLAFSSGP
ncbi:MAG: formate dehydrogenase accessory sulfurtransferase FdhD [Blastocatellia bacterium]|nr:formate dehydrogenase accessory sulfurtransferase FdhD [Blastocatellia bacterium]MCS7156311.1 formate dehydrogenase accessory sulfurtransferase FdhD [Blastocatellia bacterium]MCX7751339.1 formate dehydrogenase accessory sulfurtransferase FdhD [Blastocatellia bacterium]MDW8169051.1 formate dehydrogenase accessory sulfurtransferase FdhD [Acidobacteriota bacterium]MDW8256411.1 formate dehydrogenase accessory sulfurtransferase FdhD [Acidobacteriota bacterium]